MTLSCQGRWSPLKNSCTKKLVYGLANFSRQLSFMLSEIQHGFKQFCEPKTPLNGKDTKSPAQCLTHYTIFSG